MTKCVATAVMRNSGSSGRSRDVVWSMTASSGLRASGRIVLVWQISAQKLVECHKPRQSPAPGFGEKYWSLPGFPSHSLESGGGAFLTVIFGQIFAYSAFSDSHFSSPGSLLTT